MKSCQQRDSFKRNHRYAKCLIVGLSLYNDVLGNETTALIYQRSSKVLVATFKLEKLFYNIFKMP